MLLLGPCGFFHCGIININILIFINQHSKSVPITQHSGKNLCCLFAAHTHVCVLQTSPNTNIPPFASQ